MKCCGLPRGGRDWCTPARRYRRRGGTCTPARRYQKETADGARVRRGCVAAGFRQHAAASPPSKPARAAESVRLRATRAAHFHYLAAASRRRQRAVSQRHPSLPRRPRGVGTATAARLISKPAAPRPECGRRHDSQQGHSRGGTRRPRRTALPPTLRCRHVAAKVRVKPRFRRCRHFPPGCRADSPPRGLRTTRRSAARCHHATAALDARGGF